MKLTILTLLALLAGPLSWGLKITNETNEDVWCSVYCMKDQLPVDSLTRGWWQIANRGSATIGGESPFVCNAYFCKNSTGKQWTNKNSGVQIKACVDEKASPFKILHADRVSECQRLGATTVTFGLINPDANIRLVP